MELMAEAGFGVAVIPLPGDGDGCGEHLFCGILGAGQTDSLLVK